MAKNNKDTGLPQSKLKVEAQETIKGRIKGEDFGSAAVNAIGEKKLSEIRELAYGATVATMSTLDALELMYGKLSGKDDLGLNVPVKGKPGEFVREPKFSDELAAKIANCVKAHKTLSDKFDAVMGNSEAGEKEWGELKTEAANAKKVLNNDTDKK